MRTFLCAWLLIGLTGCASFTSMSSKMKTFVFRSGDDNEDPLVAGATVSSSYRKAKRQLNNADTTMLKFAQWCEERGDHLEAKTRYQDILADNPDNVEARVGIARVEFATGRKQTAAEILSDAAKKYPENAQVWMEMGRVQSAQEQWGQAAQSLRQAVALKPGDQQARFELGLALARSERTDEAIRNLTEAVGESAAYYNIGYILHERQRSGEAAHWFRRALDSHPDDRTRVAAARMLTELSSGTQSVAAVKPKSRVDMSQTRYEVYRETPDLSHVQTASASTDESGGQNVTADWKPPATAGTGQTTRVHAAVSTQISEPAGRASTANVVPGQLPAWNGPAQPQAPGYVRSAAPAPASNNGPVQPPMWNRAH